MTDPDAVLDGFQRVFGRPADGLWSAPGRANLIGEFTDFNDGYVLPFALGWSARAAVARRDDDRIRVASAQRGGAGSPAPVAEVRRAALAPGAGRDWFAYVHGVAWALERSPAGLPAGGADIYLDSDVPIGAGLSSSAAVECAVALALHDLFGLAATRRELATAARRAENDYVGVPTGVMDQMASLCCTAEHALFLDTRSLEARHVALRLSAAGLALVLVNTNTPRTLAGSAYGDRRDDCRRAAAQLGVAALRDVPLDDLDAALAELPDPTTRRRARHVVTEDARVLEVVALLDAGRPEAVGPVLSEGHRSLRDDFEVSSPALDLAVEVAVDHGALGARMVGGGFGGAVLALVPAGRTAVLGDAVAAAFAAEGLPVPSTSPVAAAGGATRLR